MEQRRGEGGRRREGGEGMDIDIDGGEGKVW